MQYHKASFIGHERSKNAQHKLFDYTGYAMLTYTVKQDGNGFAPVGEEMLVGKMEKETEAMLFLCDSDGLCKGPSRRYQRKRPSKLQENGDVGFRIYCQIKTVTNQGWL